MSGDHEGTGPAPVRWGFLGAGGIATDSVGPAVRAADGSVLHAVASGDEGRSRALGPRSTYPRYEQVLADPDVDVVYIALHNSVHVQWCEQALRAGKHVLCEKPLAMTAADVARLTDTAAGAGRLLVEAMWSRWHPRMRELPGLFGQPTGMRVDAGFEGPRPAPENYRHDPELGGGALLDLGCYAVASVLDVFGWESPEVLAADIHNGPRGADESAEVTLGFSRGTATVRVALDGGHAQHLNLSAGPDTATLSAPVFTALDEEADVVLRGAGGASRRVRYPACNPYRLMIEAVAAAVGGADAWVVPLSQSHAVAATLDAIRAAGRVRA